MNEELMHTFEALTIILEDTRSFNKVFDGVFHALDPERSGSISIDKIKTFINGTTLKMEESAFSEVFSDFFKPSNKD